MLFIPAEPEEEKPGEKRSIFFWTLILTRHNKQRLTISWSTETSVCVWSIETKPETLLPERVYYLDVGVFIGERSSVWEAAEDKFNELEEEADEKGHKAEGVWWKTLRRPVKGQRSDPETRKQGAWR